jgi:maltoporin
MPVDVHGYLRSGVGNSLSGGKQGCYNNPGSQGNEFRLGNECGIYGETTFALEFLEKNKSDSSFKLQTTLAYFPSANTQYGDESKNNDLDIVEAFFEAKKLEDAPYTYWIGKRFYRDADVHMNDFYYFAAMNGVGAGIADIPLFNGKLAVAYLQETMTSTATTPTNEQIVKSYLDFRLFGINTASLGELNFWGTLAHAPAGTIDSKSYQKVDGESLGVRLHNKLNEGQNDFAIIYGRNLMSSLSVYGNGEIVTGANNTSRYIIRLVEHLTRKASSNLEYNFTSSAELRNLGKHDSLWWDIGTRPVYFISEHLHFVTELGHSEVIEGNSTKTLTRATVAYEIALNKSIWARPVLRAFVSETIWNNENKVNFNNKSEGHSVGFQAEVFY